MKLRLYLKLLIILSIPGSCANPDQKSAPVPAPEKFELSLHEFSEIPEDIEGCSCYFAESSEKFDSQHYLFAANYDSTAYVSVNHHQIKLKLVKSTRHSETYGDYDHTDIYTSENYSVEVEINYISSKGYESWWNSGKIIIEDRQGNKLQKEFVGECGC